MCHDILPQRIGLLKVNPQEFEVVVDCDAFGADGVG
jgi:hypothetical protein